MDVRDQNYKKQRHQHLIIVTNIFYHRHPSRFDSRTSMWPKLRVNELRHKLTSAHVIFLNGVEVNISIQNTPTTNATTNENSRKWTFIGILYSEYIIWDPLTETPWYKWGRKVLKIIFRIKNKCYYFHKNAVKLWRMWTSVIYWDHGKTYESVNTFSKMK